MATTGRGGALGTAVGAPRPHREGTASEEMDYAGGRRVS